MQQPPTSPQASSQEGHVADLLSAYMDNRLTPVERLRVGAHLPDCPDCRAQLATLQSTVLLLHELPVVASPRPFYVYPDEAPAPRPASILQRLFGPGWVYGYLRLATTVASLLLVAVVSLDALSLSAPRAAAPAPAASRGAVQAEGTPLTLTTGDSAGAEPSVSAPTEAPRVSAPMTAPGVPTTGAPAPALATPPPAGPTSPPAPPAASVTPGLTTPPAAGAGPLLSPPAASVTPAPGIVALGPGSNGIPSPDARETNPALTAQPTAAQSAGKSLAPSPAATASPQPQPAPPSPTAGAASVAPFVAPAAPPPGQETAPAGLGALSEPVGAAPTLSDSPGMSLLRLGEIGLGALVIVLLALTLFARTKRKPTA
jgi:hypothetical protein